MGKYTDDLSSLEEVKDRRDANLFFLQSHRDSVKAAEIVAECNKVLQDARLYGD